MQSRRDALRAYFGAVVADLMQRGAIRSRRGQSLESILREEGPLIAREVRSDFATVLGEVGMTIASGASQMAVGAVQKHVDFLVNEAVRGLGRLFSGEKKG